EVEKMRRDAEAHAAEDEERRTLVEARNKADQAIYQIEKLLKEQGDKVPADVREKIEAKKKDVEKAKAGTDAAAMERAVEDLMNVSQDVARAMYEQANRAEAGAEPAAGPTEAPPERGGVAGAGKGAKG